MVHYRYIMLHIVSRYEPKHLKTAATQWSTVFAQLTALWLLRCCQLRVPAAWSNSSKYLKSTINLKAKPSTKSCWSVWTTDPCFWFEHGNNLTYANYIILICETMFNIVEPTHHITGLSTIKLHQDQTSHCFEGPSSPSTAGPWAPCSPSAWRAASRGPTDLKTTKKLLKQK